MLDPTMFRAYDIRGTYPDQLNAGVAEIIGKSFGTYLQRNLALSNPRVAVGRDGRTHGPELYQAFIQGLLSTGCQVAEVGLSPSPLLYFTVTHAGFDAGCNLTASHNPKEYNGFKLVTQNAHAVFGEELQKILEICQKGDFSQGLGQQSLANEQEAYWTLLKRLFEPKRKLKVVVDTANGVPGAFYPQMIERLGHEVIGLYTELNGTFPNHEPDPVVPANLMDLIEKVKEKKADLGLAFDGDGDRVGVVTEKGDFINADLLLMLLAKDVLNRHSGRSIVFTVSNSQSLFDLVQQWGGKPVMCKVGHSFVEQAMTESNAILGGEQSGHFFLPEDYYPYDDALVAACRVLKILSDSQSPLSDHFLDFPQLYAEVEMRPYCADAVKFEVLTKIQHHFKDKYPNTLLDGIRMDFGQGGWCGIRVSNTSPCLSITMEAQTPEHLAQIKEIVMGHLKGYPEIVWN